MDQNPNETQQSPKQQVAERVRQATNVLVTVRSNPTVDELSATIGLTLMLNKLGKHATAVFSGQIPSTIEFLKPEETIETNTDSLRDFIVSLDKAKADKLRYKVEENVVKIFITPYRTSISQDDLEFTQGDFNVDVVLALGVSQREELDQAIVSHGRILHDATVISVTAGQQTSELGTINWQDAAASSLSEMLVSISEALQGGIIDSQMATAFLTGIVAETERFSNTKTSPKVMTMAAQLMAAGANQQLIANELQKSEPIPSTPEPKAGDDTLEILKEPASASADGALEISHDEAPASEQPSEPEKLASDETAEATLETDKLEDAKKETTEAFLPPLPPSEESQSIDPLMQGDVHEENNKPEQNDELPLSLPELMPESSVPESKKEDIHIDDQGNITRKFSTPKHKVIQPLGDGDSPSFAQGNYEQTAEEPTVDPFALPQQVDAPVAPDSTNEEQSSEPTKPSESTQQNQAPQEVVSAENNNEQQSEASHFPPPPPPAPDLAPETLPDNTTLEQIEEAVHSPHLQQEAQAASDVDSARNAVNSAIDSVDFDPANTVRSDINANPLGELHQNQDQPQSNDQLVQQPVEEQQGSNDLPPPVPPPMMPPQ